MSDAWEREMYEELYAMRSKMESLDSRVIEVLNELIKIRRLMEEDRGGRGGHGTMESSDDGLKKPSSSFRRGEEKKKFGLF